jgi:large repetitive protein
VENLDIAPTITALVGMDWGADGLSFLPILDKSATDIRDAALIEWCQGRHYPCTHPVIPFTLPLPPSLNGLVTQTMKYVEYATGEVEMYDLVNDPYEIDNLAGQPGYEQQQQDLSAELAAARAPPPPETTIYTGPEGVLADRGVAFAFFSQSRLATYQCRLTTDGVPGAWMACDQGSITLGALPDGSYVFEAYATDEVGAVDPTPASRSFSIQATGPDAHVDSAPPPHTQDQFLTFGFSSGTPGVTFECQLALLGSVGAWAPCDPSTGVSYGPLTDGNWLFQVRADDGLGNITQPPAASLIHVDTTGPVMTFLDSPTRYWPSTDAQFIFRPDEAVLGSVSCKLDSGAWVDCSSGVFSASGLSEIRHTLSVSAKDELGTSHTTKIRWTVDVTPPVLTIDGPGPYTNATDATLTFSANEVLLEPTPACALDGENLVDEERVFPACRKKTLTVQDLADGTHVLQAAADDAAENLSAVVSWSWTVDTIAPVTTITSGPANPTFETTATFEFAAVDATPVTFKCKLDQEAAKPCSSGVSYTGLSVGNHHFRIVTTDSAGNVGATAQWAWQITSLRPGQPGWNGRA